MKFPSTPLQPPTQMYRGAYIQFFKIKASIFCCTFFKRISQLSRQDQQNGKKTYCQSPPYSFMINLKDTPSHISMDSLGGFISLRNYLLNFF